MLKVVQEYFASTDAIKVRDWLSSDGAALFRKAIHAEMAQLTIQAAEKQLKGMTPGLQRFLPDANNLLMEVDKRQQLLALMDAMKSPDYRPFTVKITQSQ